jgi:hypothetical protein
MYSSFEVLSLKKVYIFALLIFLLSSCTSNNNEMTETEKESGLPVQVSVSENGAVTRSSTTVSPNATEYTGTNLSLSYYYGDNYDRYNVKWEADSVGILREWQQMSEMTNPMKWESATIPVEVTAYAPYVPGMTVNDLYEIPFKVQNRQTWGLDSSDFVRYYNSSFVPGQNLSKVNICFDHQLCKLKIKIKAGPTERYGVTQGKIDSLTWCKVGPVCDSIHYDLFTYPGAENLPSSYTADYIKFPVTTISGEAKDSDFIYTYHPADSDSSYQECILPPQTIRQGNSFIQVLVWDFKNCWWHIYVYRPTQPKVLEANHCYTITLELGDVTLHMSSFARAVWNRETADSLDLK